MCLEFSPLTRSKHHARWQERPRLRRKGGGKGKGFSQSTSFGGACNSQYGVCLCPVQAPHCLLHGLPGPWALDWTPEDLPSIWSWGGLIEIFHVFETLHERLACGRRSQPCLLGGLPVSCLAHYQGHLEAPHLHGKCQCLPFRWSLPPSRPHRVRWAPVHGVRACSLSCSAVIPRSPGHVVQTEGSPTLEPLACHAGSNPRESKMIPVAPPGALKDGLAFRVWQRSPKFACALMSRGVGSSQVLEDTLTFLPILVLQTSLPR